MTGAVIAAAIAWVTILLAVVLPLDRVIDLRDFRLAGAGTLAIVGLQILGLPLPPVTALGFFAVALAGGVLRRVVAGRRGNIAEGAEPRP